MSLPPSASEVLIALSDIARQLGAVGQPTMLSDRADAVVARVAGLVVKAHPFDADAAALHTRLRLAAHPRLHRILVPPAQIDGDVLTIRSGRVYSAWPYGEPVDPDDPDAAPWEAAAALLAALHNCPLPSLIDDSVSAEPSPATDGTASHASASTPTARHPIPIADTPTRVTSGYGPEVGSPTPAADRSPATTVGFDRRTRLPAAGGPERVQRAMDRLRAATGIADPAAADVVWRAYGRLPSLQHGENTIQDPRRNPGEISGPRPAHSARRQALVHGDFHLGQLIRLPTAASGRGRAAQPPSGGRSSVTPGDNVATGDNITPATDVTTGDNITLGGAVTARGNITTGGENRWRLVDVDDLGVGDPVWDLARPAGFFAAGILDPVAWERFLTAYRRSGGPAVPGGGDVWAVLDIPARALVVQTAAIAVAKAGLVGRELDELDTALVDSCYRMPPAVW
ncbi:hypothetical protein HLB23_08455 [Nocardia uniformis]|uniref:Uncharacterized protein n=1 Tax=Nocardia uniformis TaxID=53432 RepID=A0A849BTG9_9NOCA|nr:hypothetical protein [Nocardia uniformis]NNH69893.1 hypothetical protein [Nocardia uniformis]